MKTFKGLKISLALVLTTAILLSSYYMLGITASAATVSSTAINTAPNTEVYSTEYFNETDFKANFTAWNNNNNASVSDGILNITAGSNIRASAQLHNTPSLNQFVSTSFVTKADLKANAIMWMRANKVEGQNDRLTGYYVQVVVNEHIDKNGKHTCPVAATLYKAHYNENDTYSLTKIGTIPTVDSINSSGAYDNIRIEGNAVYDETAQKTAINVKVFKDTTLMYSLTFEDDESELQTAGKVGLSVNKSGADAAAMSFTSFEYHTTDNNVAKSSYSAAYFDSVNFNNNFTTFNGNTNATVNADGTLSIAKGGNDRASAQFVTKKNANQSVTAIVKNPHAVTDSGNVYTASSAVVWLKAFNIKRALNNENAAYGYFVRVNFSGSNDIAQIMLYKQALNDNGNDIANTVQLGTTVNISTLSSDKTKFLNVKIEASVVEKDGVSTITVKPYKDTYINNAWVISLTDDTAALQGKGVAGLSANSSAATFTAFSVSSNDAVAPAYVKENSAKADSSVMFGQTISIDPNATYKLSVTADGDFTEDPLILSYKGGSAPLEFTPTTADVVTGVRYKTYTYTIAPINATPNINNELVAASVGFFQKSATKDQYDFTGIELRKVNGDGTLGVNLLVNSDFKMGFFSWSDDVGKANYNPNNLLKLDSYKDNRTRYTYYLDTNNYNYYSKFAVENFADYLGDANEDGHVDICDLVRINRQISVKGNYNLYGDMNSDAVLDSVDLATVRTDILSGKN